MATFRIDDVNPNTDFKDLYNQILELKSQGHSVLLGVNVLASMSNEGSVYPNPPFKNNSKEFFYDVTRSLDRYDVWRMGIEEDEVASHGLIHADHSKLSEDAQEMSILTSCNYLGANKFIPPFNFYNQVTVDVCHRNGILLIRNDETTTWNSLETEDFDPKKSHWYYHPWRINFHQLMEKLDASKNLNELP